MSKDKQTYFIDNCSWLDCIGQLKDQQQQNLELNAFNNHQNKIPSSNDKQDFVSSHKDSNQDLIDLISMQENIDKEMFKRSHPGTLLDEEFFSSSNDPKFNEEELEEGQTNKNSLKKQKYTKQYIYSKNYRDKKKQQFKALQEENKFLKNKVEELQRMLRQQELQNNRLKHHSNQKQLTIQQLNRQFMQKISFLAEEIQSTISQKNKIEAPKNKSRSELEREFIEGYDEHGFSGSKKKVILQYHMNEILQVVLRDSEKYLCMLCCNNKDDNFEKQIPEYQKINDAFFQIMELNETDMERLKLYTKFLFPAMKEIRKECTQMYHNFDRIIKSMDRVHYLMKSTYCQNIDFVIKRMKVQSWFEYHKYHKIMRRLKSEWLDYVKKGDKTDVQNTNKHKRGYKKKKTEQTMANE